MSILMENLNGNRDWADNRVTVRGWQVPVGNGVFVDLDLTTEVPQKTSYGQFHWAWAVSDFDGSGATVAWTNPS